MEKSHSFLRTFRGPVSKLTQLFFASSVVALTSCGGGGGGGNQTNSGLGTNSNYAVTVSGDGNETFSATTIAVPVNTAASLTVTANTEHLLSTTVGGTCAAGSWSGGVYTTGALTGNCTLVFAAAPVRRIFILPSISSANMGGAAGADALCQASANKPTGSSTYKALIVDGSTRVACTTANCAGGASEHMNWVLAANMTYVRVDGTTIIQTANSDGLLPFPLQNSVTATALSAVTGLNQDWTTAPYSCSGWTTGSASVYGNLGISSPSYLGADFIDTTNIPCDTAVAGVYCVEQ